MSIRSTLVAATLGIAFITAPTLAQDQGGAAPTPPPAEGQQRDNDGGGRGGNRRGNWDPAQMQQRMMEQLKEQLKAQDNEWKVLEPKLAKVMEAQRDMRFGGGMGFGGRGGGGGGGNRDNNNPDQPQSELQKAGRELRTTLQSDGAAAADIEVKLKTYREAREKAQENLKTAREDLKGVLTQRQEAVLVMAGMLE